MSNIFKKTTVLSSILAASAAASMAHADQPTPGYTITPSIGYVAPAGERNIEDDRAIGFSAGYQFDNPWAVEFTYLNVDTEFDGSNIDVDGDQYRIDSLYHFANNTAFTPYVAAGLGTTEYSNNVSGDGNTQLNAGGGVKYAIKENLALRADYRLLDDLEGSRLDQVATLGLQMTFGGPEKAEPVVEQEPVVEPQPVVETQPVAEPEPVKTVLPYEIHFGFDSAKVQQADYQELQEIADYLNENPNKVAQIQGYADSVGTSDYNQDLSKERAEAVASLLVEEFGIDSSRLDTVGFGEKYPVEPNTSPENRAENRRATTVAFISKEAMENDSMN